MRTRAALLALTTALLLPAVAQADTRSVGIKSSGKTVQLDKGDTLKIKLRENPSTGFGWRVTAKPAKSVAKLKSNKYKADPQEKGSVGGGGTRTYTYTAKGAGTTSVTIKLFPPGSRKASEKFTLKLKVG